MVAMLAVLALGVVAVPIAPTMLVQEAACLVAKSQAAWVLVSSFDLEQCRRPVKHVATTINERFRGVPIGPCTFIPTLKPSDILISSDRALDENAPIFFILTSDTTGSLKSAVLRRSLRIRLRSGCSRPLPVP